MISKNGNKRVIIENIFPQVDRGKFPAKAVIGDEIQFSASIFGDGHDAISASLFLKHIDEQQFAEIPLTALPNDFWQANYRPQRTGLFEFYVEGWEDHFKHWKDGLKKKHDAGQDLGVEFQIGEALLTKAPTMESSQRSLLKRWIKRYQMAKSPEEKLSIAFDEELAQLMYSFRDARFVTRSPVNITIEVERKKAGFSTWYELFPRSTATQPGTHGSFKTMLPLLPRVAKMGFDVLYLPPIHPIGTTHRKGKNNSLQAGPDDPGSPWAIGNKKGGHKSIHPQLGTLTDFKRLLKEAKRLGIEIALDIAYQCSPDHPYVKTNPQWFLWRPDGTVQYAENPPKKYEDILPFNFETEDWENLWIELKSVIDFWVQTGVTIFRIDNPHTKAFPFWEWLIKEVRQKNPEIIFLAEAFTRPRLMEQLAKIGFNQSYTYFTWRNSKAELETYLTELTQTPLKHYFRPNFWPNTPDILPPILTDGGENAHIIRLILAATLSSNYGIYGPVYEFGINQPHGAKEEYVDNEKYEIKHWDWEKDTRLREIITRINKIRRNNPALQSTWNIKFWTTTNDQLMCYAKIDKANHNRIVVIANLDLWNTQSGFVYLSRAELGIEPDEHFMVKDLLSGDRYRWQGDRQYISLNPHLMPAHILEIETHGERK